MKIRKGKTRNEKIFDTLKNSEWFAKECEKVRVQYSETEDEIFLQNEAKRLAKYLPAYWQNTIKDFILTGELKMPTLEGSQVVFQHNFETDEQELFIRIFKKTTLEDIKHNWKEVQKYQSHLKEVWTPEISETDLLILHTWDTVEARPKKPKIIAREVSAILTHEHGLTYSESDIRKRVSDLRKQLHADKKV